jgi:predicted enzyme related to lactoylglutathione lyase
MGNPPASQSVPEFTLDLVILDCPDPMALASFYSTLLGWPLEEGAGDEFVVLDPPGGGVSAERPDGRATLAFQRIDDYVKPTWPGGAHPQQFHLDLSVVDIDASEPAVLAGGATVHEHQPSTDGGFRVYLDPAGHPFCLIRR